MLHYLRNFKYLRFYLCFRMNNKRARLNERDAIGRWSRPLESPSLGRANLTEQTAVWRWAACPAPLNQTSRVRTWEQPWSRCVGWRLFSVMRVFLSVGPSRRIAFPLLPLGRLIRCPITALSASRLNSRAKKSASKNVGRARFPVAPQWLTHWSCGSTRSRTSVEIQFLMFLFQCDCYVSSVIHSWFPWDKAVWVMKVLAPQSREPCKPWELRI